MFKPFENINRQTFLIMIGVQVAMALALWQFGAGGLIPQPLKIGAALGHLLHLAFCPSSNPFCLCDRAFHVLLVVVELRSLVWSCHAPLVTKWVLMARRALS